MPEAVSSPFLHPQAGHPPERVGRRSSGSEAVCAYEGGVAGERDAVPELIRGGGVRRHQLRLLGPGDSAAEEDVRGSGVGTCGSVVALGAGEDRVGGDWPPTDRTSPSMPLSDAVSSGLLRPAPCASEVDVRGTLVADAMEAAPTTIVSPEMSAVSPKKSVAPPSAARCSASWDQPPPAPRAKTYADPAFSRASRGVVQERADDDRFAVKGDDASELVLSGGVRTLAKSACCVQSARRTCGTRTPTLRFSRSGSGVVLQRPDDHGVPVDGDLVAEPVEGSSVRRRQLGLFASRCQRRRARRRTPHPPRGLPRWWSRGRCPPRRCRLTPPWRCRTDRWR